MSEQYTAEIINFEFDQLNEMDPSIGGSNTQEKYPDFLQPFKQDRRRTDTRYGPYYTGPATDIKSENSNITTSDSVLDYLNRIWFI